MIENRSNIDLLGNATNGVNLGTGQVIFKSKNVSGNTLQFKTVCGAGNVVLITGDTTLTFSGKTTGSLPVLTGMTDYVLKVNSTGTDLAKSSILDSGNTNIHICKNNIFIGSGNTVHTRIDGGIRKLDIVASSGVNIGDYNACLYAGLTNDGLTLGAAAYQDLVIHAGSCSVAGYAGKNLRLSGGDSSGAIGGDIILSGGCGTVTGRIIIPTLPNKTTETCAVYIDSNGKLSKGRICTGSTTIIGGTQNVIPVFNSAGNNIQNSSLSITNNVLANNNALTIQAADNYYLYLAAKNGSANYLVLGSPTQAGVSQSTICPAGTSANINILYQPKGSGGNHLLASYNYIGPSGSACNGLQVTSNTLGLPSNAILCGAAGSTISPDGKFVCLTGGDGVVQVGYSGSGGTLYLNGGNANGSSVKSGGSVVIKGGNGINGGANGRIQLCGLPAKTTETCGIYIDANGRLSTGVISGSSGGGGGLSVAITGATNGITAINNRCVCLGGLITAPITLCSTNDSNTLSLCSVTTSTNCNIKFLLGLGGISIDSTSNITSWQNCINTGGGITIMKSNNVANTSGNMLTMRPDAVYLDVIGTSTGFQYSQDYGSKFNSNVRAIPDVGWVNTCVANCSFWNRDTGRLTTKTSGDYIALSSDAKLTWLGTNACIIGRTNLGTSYLCMQNGTSCISIVENGSIMNFSTSWFLSGGGTNMVISSNGDISTQTSSQKIRTKAGSANSVTPAGIAYLEGGNNTLTGAGGDAYVCGGTSTSGVGGNVILSAGAGVSSGRIRLSNLPAKLPTDTYAVYIDGSGNLSCGVAGSGGSGIGWANNVGMTVAGCDTLPSSSGAINNTFFGYKAGKNTINGNNVAVGASALTGNTTGQFNIAIGVNSLASNVAGHMSVAIGAYALQRSNNSVNHAVGAYALCSTTTGGGNIGIGYTTMCSNTTGWYNTALGDNALKTSVNACFNTAVGSSALEKTTTGWYNTAVGYQSLWCNQTGNRNTAIGYGAALCQVTASGNTSIGYEALRCNFGGSYNTAIGMNAGYMNFTGNRNVMIGFNAGYNETGSDKLHIGNCPTYSLICGDFAAKIVKISDTLCAVGNMCAADFVLTSDERLKTNVQTLSISPVDIEYKQFNLISDPSQVRYGVIAQELQKVNPELVKIGSEGFLGVSYTDLLVKEVAFLKCEVKQLKNIIDEIKNKLSWD